jgi:hypothetical protein
MRFSPFVAKLDTQAKSLDTGGVFVGGTATPQICPTMADLAADGQTVSAKRNPAVAGFWRLGSP